MADDASATWWNPAGLPGSLIVDGVFEWQTTRLNSPADRPIEDASAAGKGQAAAFAFAFPAAGVSYRRTVQWRLEPANGPDAGSREEGRTVQTARSLLTQQFGVTLVQSLGDAVVVGVTPALVTGGVSAVRAAGTVENAFDDAGAADRDGGVRADLDVGVLVRAGRVRAGLTARNLGAPGFTGADGIEWRLERRVRAGVAIASAAGRAGRHDWVVALDADLTRDDDAPGSWRGVSAGVERWWTERRLGIRAGLEASTAGETRPAATAGASIAVSSGFWLEAAVTAGDDTARRGWGLAAHMMF